MSTIARLALIALSASTLSGCISTAASLVTAPVRVAGKGVDAMTTSQSEADENRGRAMRKREERLGKLQRQYDHHTDQCMKGNEGACDDARSDYAEIQSLRRY